MNPEEFISAVEELVLGNEIPDPTLIEKGEFPTGWVEAYTLLLKENRLYWQNINTWPRSLTALFYRVGFNIPYAYREWQRKANLSNPQTEKLLHSVHFCTELFLNCSPSAEWPNET